MDKTFSIIIPFKNNNKLRERNLFFILDYYKTYIPQSEIIIVEQNSTTNLTSVYNKIDKYINIKTHDDLFHKTYLINIGYNISRTDYIIIADADCVVDKNLLQNIHNYYDLLDNNFVLPYNGDVYYLTELETEYYIVNNNITLDINNIKKASGGVGIINPYNFHKVGGFDERFKGWGAEDDAFYNKCTMLGVPPYRMPYNLIHLYHPVIYNEDNNYNQNIQIYNNHFSKDKNNFIKDINYKYILNSKNL